MRHDRTLAAATALLALVASAALAGVLVAGDQTPTGAAPREIPVPRIDAPQGLRVGNLN